jgi:hypothetical protein
MVSIDELRAINGTVSYHPMGVVKLRKNYDEYWHFYSDKTPVALDTNIHSHPYSYESTILFGGLRHHIHDVVPTEEERQNSYQGRFKRSNKTPLTVIHENVDVITSTTFDTYKDDTYYIKHSTLHKIDVITPKCVTYLKAEPWQSNLFFVVAKDWNMTREQILTQKATAAECWEIIKYTLDDEDNC